LEILSVGLLDEEIVYVSSLMLSDYDKWVSSPEVVSSTFPRL